MKNLFTLLLLIAVAIPAVAGFETGPTNSVLWVQTTGTRPKYSTAPTIGGNLSVGGNITTTKNAAFVLPATTTQVAYVKSGNNTSNNNYIATGVDDSTGSSFTGTAYQPFIYSTAGIKIYSGSLLAQTFDTSQNANFAANVGIGKAGATTSLDIIHSGNTAGIALSANTGTNGSWMQFSNTGGNGLVGVTGSSGGTLITGGHAYALSVVPATGTALDIGYNGGAGLAMSIDTSGVTTFPNRVKAAWVAPTVQKFSSGSGTYTLPTSPQTPTYIRVRMVGSGGGGAPGGTSQSVGATAGGNVTFGTTLLAANGGAAGTFGNSSAAAGGTSSLGTGPIGLALNGNAGVQGSQIVALTTSIPASGSGGAGFFGGAAGGVWGNTAGIAGIAGSGSGGSGGGTANANNSYSGGGGGAGGYVDAIISSPSATYAYSIGAGGSGGTSGGSGGTGGNGANGSIIVEEFYQ